MYGLSSRVLLFILITLASASRVVAGDTPVIAVIIDDMGDRLSLGQRALALEGDVTYSILPNTPYAVKFARLAHEYGREVMLHLPMQSLDDNIPPRNCLNSNMDYPEFSAAVVRMLNSVPYISGVNNHRGSLLTQRSGYMNWFMQEVYRRGKLYFVDSRTTAATVAAGIAGQYNVPNTSRDVFLDHDRDIAAINKQYERLLRKAKKHGSALAIGHPVKETLQVLERRLPFVRLDGVRLVKVSRYIIESRSADNPSGVKQWQTYLSR
jgi:polysaccharide deacetylase 2 family uncharacterized protein YibQ